MKRNFIIIALFTCSFLAKGQIEQLIYVDFSKQLNRSSVIEKIDSLISASEGTQFIYVSNGSRPLFLYSSNFQGNYQRDLQGVRPSLPSPYFDLDTLVAMIDQKGGLSQECRFNFLFSGNHAQKGELHIESIMEKFLLVEGIIDSGKIREGFKVNLLINLQSEPDLIREYQDYQYDFIKGISTIKY